jgi:hypothetical protein
MPLSVADLADALQTLFTADADHAARQSGLVRRHRLLSGAAIAQALVFGWLDDPDASCDALADGLPASAQALHRRLGPAAADCLRLLLHRAVGYALSASATGAPRLLGRFSAVWLEDCTIVALPADLADLFPGCGGSTPQAGGAGLKLFVRWDLVGGHLAVLEAHPARTADRTARAAAAADLPAGSLRIADLGFYDGAALNADSRRGGWWLTRLPTKLSVRPAGGRSVPLAAFLARRGGAAIDVELTAGLKEPVRGRLLAWRCPARVRRQRRARLRKRAAKLCRPVSAAQRALCGWTVLFTHVPAAQLSRQEAWALYRARWQVELLFKRWKQDGGLTRRRCRSGARVLCEVYAKLLGQVVSCWGEMLAGGPLAGAGVARKARRVRRRARQLRQGLRSRRALRRVLGELARALRRLRPTRRRRKPSTRQLLSDPHAET